MNGELFDAIGVYWVRSLALWTESYLEIGWMTAARQYQSTTCQRPCLVRSALQFSQRQASMSEHGAVLDPLLWFVLKVESPEPLKPLKRAHRYLFYELNSRTRLPRGWLKRTVLSSDQGQV